MTPEELLHEYQAACDELEQAAAAHFAAQQRRDEALGRMRAQRIYKPGVVVIPKKGK